MSTSFVSGSVLALYVYDTFAPHNNVCGGMSWTVSLNSHMLKPQAKNLRMWTYLETRSLQMCTWDEVTTE